jgi:hypothetical protein
VVPQLGARQLEYRHVSGVLQFSDKTPALSQSVEDPVIRRIGSDGDPCRRQSITQPLPLPVRTIIGGTELAARK